MKKAPKSHRADGGKRSVDRKIAEKRSGPQRRESASFGGRRPSFKGKLEKPVVEATGDEDMRLNKYVAHCGIASRRAAADLIKEGLVWVNGVVVNEIGYHVQPSDVVTFKGKAIKPIEDKVYILLNKPKNTITTVSDEKDRKTVMDIVGKTIKTRIYPVGRLDRETTGLLLLTNDGDLAQKLSHPSHRIKKFYHAILNRPFTSEDLEKVRKGLELEDGVAEVDSIQHVSGGTKAEVMVEIHIGKNRIVRRIFEKLNYEVERLDRVYYAGLTKKDLPRGFYRKLTEQEVIMLKHFNNG